MDPYVLALQFYLINKFCGGIPLRVFEHLILSGVINLSFWTIKSISNGIVWLVKTPIKTCNNKLNNPEIETTTNYNMNETNNENVKHNKNNIDLLSEFEIINKDDIVYSN